MKKIISLVFFFAMMWVAAALADNTNDNANEKRYRYAVKGVVVDENNQPIPGATIRVVGTTLGAGTNSAGEFVIRLDDMKTYTIQVSFIGYEPQTLEVSSSLNPVVSKVKMKPSVNELNEVTVTGSFIERPLKDAPVITRVISQKDIQAQPNEYRDSAAI